jgi:hypothetical protein
MKCIKCSKDADVKIEDKNFCSDCFCEVIEKRVKKDVRNQRIFSTNDKNKIKSGMNILILDDGYLLKSIIKDRRISLEAEKIKLFNIKKDYDPKKRYDKMIVPWNLDDEAAEYISSLLQGIMSKRKDDKKTIIPLIGVTDNEALIFSKIKKLKYKINKQHNDARIMIEKLDKKYPGTKFSILKTIRKTRLR